MSRLIPHNEDDRQRLIARKQDLLHELVPLIQRYQDVLNGELSGQHIFESSLWLYNEIDQLKANSSSNQLALLNKLIRKKS
jgi:hypothetical protein